MKQIIISVLCLFLSFISESQEVVKWDVECKQISDSTYQVHFRPNVQSPWHIYSLEVMGGMGVPTRFSFEENPLILLDGPVEEIGLQQDFVQKVKLKKDTTAILRGCIKFMACTNEQCLPPQEVDVKVEVGTQK